VDDFALFADRKAELKTWRVRIAAFLQEYRLLLHPQHCYIFPARVGWRFLGQRVFRTHRWLIAENVRRMKRRLRRWESNPPENMEQRLASWLGHAMQADTFQLVKNMAANRPHHNAEGVACL
jgi:hypothetical protein